MKKQTKEFIFTCLKILTATCLFFAAVVFSLSQPISKTDPTVTEKYQVSNQDQPEKIPGFDEKYNLIPFWNVALVINLATLLSCVTYLFIEKLTTENV